jgi:hypothetical protein
MSKFFLSTIAAAALTFAGITSTATASVAIPPVQFAVIDGAIDNQSMIILAAASQLTDGVYHAKVSGKIAKLTIQSGKPVAYSYGSYKARRVSIKGNTVHIDKARLKITGLSSQAIVGIFTLGGKNTDVRMNRK